MVRHKTTTRERLGGRPPKRSRVGKTAQPPKFKERKSRKYRSGTVALREIQKYQTSTDLLIPKLAFQRLVKELIQDECRERDILMKKIQSPALLALQCVCEDYVTELFSMSQRAAVHGKRITVTPDDVRLVMDFRGDYTKFNKPKDRFEELEIIEYKPKTRFEELELESYKLFMAGKLPKGRTYEGNNPPNIDDE